MGGGNPVKRAADAVTDFYTRPMEAAANAAGLGGVRDFLSDTNKTIKDVNMVVTGEDKKVKAEKERQAQEAADAAETEGRRQAVAAADASFQASEKERMAAGSGARTLLTGPKGLEDEDGTTYSRRILAGR